MEKAAAVVVVGLAAAARAVAVRAVGLVADRVEWREGVPEVDVGRSADNRGKRTANRAGRGRHTAQWRSNCVG